MKVFRTLLIGVALLAGVSLLPALFVTSSSNENPAWSAAAQDVTIVEGKVVNIGEESFVVQVRRVRNCALKGQTVTVVWDENTQWTRGKRTASPDELWVGAAVTVSGVPLPDGTLYAQTVQIGGSGK